MRLLAAAAMFALSLAVAVNPAAAQTYPSQPIKLIVPYAAGGVTDLLGRLAAEHIKTRTGQPVIVENRAGEGGNTGLAAVAQAAPDGTTLGLAAVTNFSVNPYIYKSMPFDPMKDLAPVAPIAEGPQLLVVPASLPVRTLAEFIAYAKANPDRINYGSAGVGTPNHLSTDYFLRTAGIKAAHLPYRRHSRTWRRWPSRASRPTTWPTGTVSSPRPRPRKRSSKR